MAPEWRDTIESYLTHLRAAGCSRGTIRLRRHWLAQLAARAPEGPWTVTVTT
jgi:hypothetical protein